MSMHCDDIEIQDYSLQPTGSPHRHISQCDHCMERVRQYRLLFTMLKQENIFDATFPVADAVMAKLPPAPSSIRQVLSWISASTIIIALIALFIYWIFSGYDNWFSLVGNNVLLLLGGGGTTLGLFLLAFQLHRFRDMVRLINNSETLQPES